MVYSGTTLACCTSGPRFESRCGQKLVFSRKSVRYACLGTGCTLTTVPRSTQPSTLRGTVNECLQSVLYAAARLATGLRRSDHITDTLASFHWLPAPERVKFNLAFIVYRALHGMTLQYLSELLHEGAFGRLHQMTFPCLCQDLCPSEISRSLPPPQGSGTLSDDITFCFPP